MVDVCLEHFACQGSKVIKCRDGDTDIPNEPKA